MTLSPSLNSLFKFCCLRDKDISVVAFPPSSLLTISLKLQKNLPPLLNPLSQLPVLLLLNLKHVPFLQDWQKNSRVTLPKLIPMTYLYNSLFKNLFFGDLETSNMLGISYCDTRCLENMNSFGIGMGEHEVVLRIYMRSHCFGTPILRLCSGGTMDLDK
jgi:hypothetical protein